MLKKIFKNIFLHWIGWLAITVIASVCIGLKAAHTVDKISQYWTNAFWVSIFFPVTLVFFQLLWPYFLKLKSRSLIVFPIGILIAWFAKKESFNGLPDFVWYMGIPFFIVIAFLIWEQPSTDNLFNKKK